MSELVVRRLSIDLDTSLVRHWAGGDAFRTAFVNALSMSFPLGEQFFIDAVRDGVKALPPDAQARFADEVHGFVGQEATHRHLHARFNAHLARLGLTSGWEARIRERMQALAGVDVAQCRVVPVRARRAGAARVRAPVRIPARRLPSGRGRQGARTALVARTRALLHHRGAPRRVAPDVRMDSVPAARDPAKWVRGTQTNHRHRRRESRRGAIMKSLEDL